MNEVGALRAAVVAFVTAKGGMVEDAKGLIAILAREAPADSIEGVWLQLNDAWALRNAWEDENG